jgi:hypothetical protein
MNFFEKFIRERTLSPSTIDSYQYVLNEYSKLNKQTLNELIKEAGYEEYEITSINKRHIKKRLLKYRRDMIDRNLSVNTIKMRMDRVKTFYRHFELEIPYLPPTPLKKSPNERNEDTLTIEHIKKFIESTKNRKHKALVLFISSSGTSLNETINLSIQDFIEATSEYHNNNPNINEILYQLENQNDIVPLFKMLRLKTDLPYYTCCSPEAVNAIVQYLKFEDNLTPTRQLFKYSKGGFLSIFNRFNNSMGWGKVGNQGFFHSNGLRMFHARAIEDIRLTNTLQGRKTDHITETYFKMNPRRIKEEYIKHLPKLTVNNFETVHIDSEEVKNLKKSFYEQLKIKEEENLAIERRLSRLEEVMVKFNQ